ncbi:hypothetical protein [Synergistes jonesii]|uniref:Uncharacterized protein n=1 Tax=Synergistes jonesii TaxID=2754 RepID=A0A073ITD4_9BACT|nr:hypothetical protein [Synergistes jonesii]KEJ93009.1 hypothetical protein EH55_13525 [Synergistes jonesii]OFB62512.1 hypothetical protein JS72_08145 [Synergistes jonesii]OFB64566.1 hypothetical protein JS73_03180 [Synergistes jonesii]OFB65765.1 hypothetical protein JS79_03765 [Synergistes jonesii]OFB68757.1 hypothetical protein JS78_03185 [Synergistes jonesii]
MSRAFIKEDDGERGNAVADIQFREAKVEWLKIQEKKLDTLLNDPKSKRIKPETLDRWIKETRADIEKTKKELGYEK